MRDESMLAAAGTAVGVVGLLSLPAASSLILQLRKRGPRQDTYEDADGKSTPDAVKAYSAKWAKAAILLLASAGSGTAIALAVLSTLSTGRGGQFLENWLVVGAWILILFQAVATSSSRISVQAYSLGLHSFFSCSILAVFLLVQDTKVLGPLLRHEPVLFALRVANVVVLLLLGIANLCIPRRPDVYDAEGRQVDPLYTVSAWSRFNFSWPDDILRLARKKNNLDLADLPRPDHYTRAKDVSRDWERRNPDHPLWLSLILAHKSAFALQWLLTLGLAVLNFAPQWVILQLLRILEVRGGRENYGADVWMWVVWLGITIIVQSFVESYTFWLSIADLTIPIRAQLSSLIFEKSMRRKDVKGTGKSSNKKTPDTPAAESAEPTVAGGVGESTAADRPEVPGVEEDDEVALNKSKQSTVNLIGVDAKRIADFASFQNLFPGSLFKLLVSLAFLDSLLGWRALLAGFSTMVAIMPANVYFSKRYAAAQDRLMKVRDEKTEVVTEALQGIRQIKFSALEPEWEDKIGGVRERELDCVWDVFKSDTMLLACWITSPILLSAVSLAVYATLTGSLTPSVAFVSLGVFKALEVTLSVVPELTTDLLDAWVSIKRIDEYLKSPEISNTAKKADEVTFDNASVAWPADDKLEDGERFVLRDVTATFPKGELSVISGKTGTGKSLMLAAILGEVDVLSGSIGIPEPPSMEERHDTKATKANWIIPNAIAYVAQIPWIENASIRDNIVFGLPYDEERYNKTVEVCALTKDLEMLSDGESTEIGVNGINLSGGQKWRVTLARAIYSRAGILVMDDIFSAVDAHVGRHIFEKCLNGELAAGRTRILVTHHVALCEPKTKYLVELGDGRVLNAGLLSELREDGTLQHIKSHEQSQEEILEDEAATAVDSADSADGEDSANGDTLKKVTSKAAAGPRKFVEEETREKGAVKKRVYGIFLKASGGIPYWTLCIVLFLLVETTKLGRSWWLRIWTGNYAEESANAFHTNASKEHAYAYSVSLQHTPIHTQTAPDIGKHGLTFYLGIYIGLAIISSVITTLRFFILYVQSIKASRVLFAKMNYVVLRTPLRWLDTVPVGRVLNRFTADFNTIDSQLATSFGFFGGSLLSLVGVIVAGYIVSPWIVLLAAVLLAISLHFAILYLEGARPVKRLESTSKSPVFEQFGSALSGVSTIRGFDKTHAYVERMYKKLDDYTVAVWHLWLFNRWMGWRMNVVGSFFSVFVASIVLLTPGIDSALAGFALAFALEFSSCVMWTVRLYANVELNMNASERVIEYTELPTENLEGRSPPAAWPTEGRIEVDDLVVGYAADLPPVLKGLTFSVNSNERVGVIGRTGAGKSSLTLALFRFLEAQSGSIYIDGQDISKIRLHDLRSRLAIIPQDPVLFSGTVRSNLDPFNRHTDAELRDSLQRVHLIATTGTATPTPTPTPAEPAGAGAGRNANAFSDLASPVSEGGLNLSQGQRQLLCLARAIVARPRVMVLDEATSAVDMHTDSLIQRSIREEFTDATLLVIAHRLSTIADFDRILVLSDGRVAEHGSPRELWDKGSEEGVFRGMCEESGEREKLRRIVFGEE